LSFVAFTLNASIELSVEPANNREVFGLLSDIIISPCAFWNISKAAHGVEAKLTGLEETVSVASIAVNAIENSSFVLKSSVKLTFTSILVGVVLEIT
jgi:hypothetical protein